MLPPYLDSALVLPGGREIVGELHSQPRFRRTAKSLGEPDSHFRANARLAVNHVVKRLPGNAENFCPRGYGEAQGLQTITPDDTAGMRGIFHGDGVSPLFSDSRLVQRQRRQCLQSEK